MEEIDKKITNIIEKIATRENLLPFLRLLGKHLNLTLENVLLVYDQNPNAEVLCGKGAWEKIGKSVHSDVNSIKILYPEINTDENICFRYVSVYSMNCVVEKEIDKIPFADRITEVTGFGWEMIPENDLDEGLSLGKCDFESRTFYILKKCPDDLLDQIIIGLYLDYVMKEMMILDPMIKQATLYVLCEHWNIKNTIVTALFGKVFKTSYNNNRKKLIEEVYILSERIVDDIEGVSLSFNEVAYINELLSGTDVGDIKNTFSKVAESIRDIDLKYELQMLTRKLIASSTAFREMIFLKKMNKELFSYPPIYFEFQDKELEEHFDLEIGSEVIN